VFLRRPPLFGLLLLADGVFFVDIVFFVGILCVFLLWWFFWGCSVFVSESLLFCFLYFRLCVFIVYGFLVYVVLVFC